jgi:Domain of unknown function (DUF5753)
MRAQLQRLAEVGEQSGTMVQVIPYDVGAHAGTASSFVVLGFAQPGDTDVVYMETIGGNLWVDRAEEVRHYNVAFDHLRAIALSPDNTRAMLNTVIKELK